MDSIISIPAIVVPVSFPLSRTCTLATLIRFSEIYLENSALIKTETMPTIVMGMLILIMITR